MTNTVLKVPGLWVNADGLQVRFPGAGISDAVMGKVMTADDEQHVIIDLDWRHMPAFQTNEQTGCIYGGLSNVSIPAGAFIKSCTVETMVAFVSTGSSTTSIGLVQADGTELDNDGLVDAIAKTSMDAVGETTTGAGALIGTILASTANAYYVWVTVQTATFTAGQARVKIIYYMPTTNTAGAVPA